MSAKNVQYVPLLARYDSSSSSSESPDGSANESDDDDNIAATAEVKVDINNKLQQIDNISNKKKSNKRKKNKTTAISDSTNSDNKICSDSGEHKSSSSDKALLDLDHSSILRDSANCNTSLFTDDLVKTKSIKDYHHNYCYALAKSTTSFDHIITDNSGEKTVRINSNKSYKKQQTNGNNDPKRVSSSEFYRKRDRNDGLRKLLKYLTNPFSSSPKANNSSSVKTQSSSDLSSYHLLYPGNYRRRNMSLVKLFNFIFQKSVLALIGAVLIHITLGTVYTLSNVNSYMTSYLKMHSAPYVTYGGAIWITSMNAVGQGFAMVMGGYIEKKFSARVSCFIGCTIHSMSIASTRWSLEYGFVPVVISYGLLPGLGAGLAYITPITNGFGWFPNRKGLVSGFILAGYGIGTFIFNMVQTAYVNPHNLSPDLGDKDPMYFTQAEIMKNVPSLFTFMGSIYAAMQFVGCCLLFKPSASHGKFDNDELPIFDNDMSIGKAIKSKEFLVMYLVYGVTTQGVLFMNSMYKKYGQIYIADDMYLAWTGSLASIANCLGRLSWGIAVDRFNFTKCFTMITIIFGTLMFLMPFEFILSSKLLYLSCTLGIFGSFSGWFAIYPVHCAKVFGRKNAGIIYGLLFTSQSFGGIFMAFVFRHLIDNYNRYIPCITVFFMEAFGLTIYHLLYPY